MFKTHTEYFIWKSVLINIKLLSLKLKMSLADLAQFHKYIKNSTGRYLSEPLKARPWTE